MVSSAMIDYWTLSILIICLLGAALSKHEESIPMSFESPKLTEEEHHSQHIPSNLQCDACHAVAYQMTAALEKAESKIKGKPLKESQYLDIFETVCTGKAWEEYGLKGVNGVNHISGPGLPMADSPGMVQGGGKWPNRMMQKCSGFLGEIGEDELYEEYRKNKDLKTYLCVEASKDCTTSSKAKPKKEL